MKFECKVCAGDPCILNVGRFSSNPTKCPIDVDDCKWHEVAEPAALPKLTAEDPDWLKVGAWAAVGKFVGKIDWINRDASECRITCGESRFAKNGEAKAVTWRAWNDDEMRKQVGKILKNKKFSHHLLVTECGCRPDGSKTSIFTGAGTIGEMADEVLEKHEQLNGMPCGVPQVDGKDLEGMPCD